MMNESKLIRRYVFDKTQLMALLLGYTASETATMKVSMSRNMFTDELTVEIEVPA